MALLMKLKTLLFLTLPLTAAFVLPRRAPGNPAPNPLVQEPVVVMTTGDPNLPGGDQTLIVYNSGRVVVTDPGLPPFGIPARVVSGAIDPSEVADFVRTMVRAGFLSATDEIPAGGFVGTLRTLTLMTSGTTARARTVSYVNSVFFPGGITPEYNAIVDEFLANHIDPLLH